MAGFPQCRSRSTAHYTTISFHVPLAGTQLTWSYLTARQAGHDSAQEEEKMILMIREESLT